MLIVPYQDSYRAELISVWESSVRSTHHFLNPDDIHYFKAVVEEIDFNAFGVYCLIADNQVKGFIGITGRTIEMLFLDPSCIGKGYGKQLMDYVINEFDVDQVEVNEHNAKAVKFYSQFGFVVYERTEKDPQGKDYPILKMARQAVKSILFSELTVRKIQEHDPVPYALLLDADPSKELVDSYLAEGQVYLAILKNVPVGVYVLWPVDFDTIEIKNIAVAAHYQGKVIGKMLLADALRKGKEQGYKEIIIGTSTTSIGPLYLYQKVGFEFSHILKNFFLEHYPEPLFDNGLQCRHMIVLTKKLGY